jgi:hypothetical protein
MNYSTLSLSELKALAIYKNAIPTGDKRSKQAWIDALESVDAAIKLEYEECTEVAEFLRANPDAEGGSFGDHCSYQTVNERGENDPSPISELPSPISIDTPTNPLLGGAIEPQAHIGVGHTSTKKGATAVFASLLCILILAVQSTLYTACIIVQAAIHLKNLFGSYNPDYDLFGQINDMVRERKLSIACA